MRAAGGRTRAGVGGVLLERCRCRVAGGEKRGGRLKGRMENYYYGEGWDLHAINGTDNIESRNE